MSFIVFTVEISIKKTLFASFFSYSYALNARIQYRTQTIYIFYPGGNLITLNRIVVE